MKPWEKKKEELRNAGEKPRLLLNQLGYRTTLSVWHLSPTSWRIGIKLFRKGEGLGVRKYSSEYTATIYIRPSEGLRKAWGRVVQEALKKGAVV